MREMRYVQRFVTPAIGLFVLFAVLGLPGMAAAAPTILNPMTNPSHLDLNRRTDVTVTAFVDNAQQIFSGSFNLERINADGSVTVLGQLKDDGSKGDRRAADQTYTVVQNFNVSQSGIVRLRIAGRIVLTSDRTRTQRIVSDEFQMTAGTISGGGGTTLTIPPGSFPVNFVASIDQVPNNTIVAPVNIPNVTSQDLVAAVEIVLEPRDPGVDVVAPTQPLQITIPLPANVNDTKFLVAEQVLVPSLGTQGLTPRLRVAAAAALVGGNTIITQPSPLPGLRHSGIYAIVTARGSGYVTGVVSDANGPVANAIVNSNTNGVLAATDGAGHYSLFVSGAAFRVDAFDAFRGTFGSTTGTTIEGQAVQANIAIAPLDTQSVLDTQLVHLDGIRNAGFENCTLPVATPPAGADASTGGLRGTWAFVGNAKAVPSLTTIGSPQVTILPREGSCMLDISSGLGAQNRFSKAGQRFTVPAGVRTLSFDFTFVSEEFPEFVGTQFNDTFRARITPSPLPNGEPVFAQLEVNSFVGKPGGFTLIGDCFPNLPDQGDETCGQINDVDVNGVRGWRTATINLSTFANTGTPVIVDLEFEVEDAGDNFWDTHVLIDNIRFGTVWVDAKIVNGANANATRVANDIRSANDVLSQAGLIVRLRNPQPTVFTDAALLQPDITYTSLTGTCNNQTTPAQLNGQPSSEETALMGRSRSGTTTDINAYYAQTAFRDGVLNPGYMGYAVGPDEFCNFIDINASSGLILFDGANDALRAGVPAHEIGHLLIAPDNAFEGTEHGTSDSLNFMWGTNTPVNGFMTRPQSLEINRPPNYPNNPNNSSNPLIVP